MFFFSCTAISLVNKFFASAISDRQCLSVFNVTSALNVLMFTCVISVLIAISIDECARTDVMNMYVLMNMYEVEVMYCTASCYRILLAAECTHQSLSRRGYYCDYYHFCRIAM